jgi:integrase
MECKKCRKEIPDQSIYCMYCGANQIQSQRRTKSRGNGTGTVFKLPNGKYLADVTVGYYVDKNGKLHRKRRTKTCERRKDALAALQMLKNAPMETKTPTLLQLYEMYQSTKKYDKLSQSQKDKMRFAWDKLEPIQLYKISDLNVQIMQSAINKATDKYYPARDMKVLLSHLYTIAIQHDYEKQNKTEYIELPDAPTAKRQVFNEEDIAKFWDDYNGQCPTGASEAHEFTGYILIMIYTGMRTGELFGIAKDNVFLDKRYMIGGEKTAAGRDREIPISDLIYPIIERFYNQNNKKLIHMNLDNFYENYWNTIERLHIRHYPPLTCRHTFFSLLAQNRVHPALIAAMGGHAQYQTAIDNYNRLPVSEKIAAANKI